VNGIDFMLGSNLPPIPILAPFGGITGNMFVLDASSSIDPDGDPISYGWTQISGPPSTIQSPTAAVTVVNSADQNQLLVYRLVVQDPFGAQASLNVPVNHGPIRVFIEENIGENSYSLSWTLGAPAQPYALRETEDLITPAWTNIYQGNDLHVEKPCSNGVNRLYFLIIGNQPP
ncbi:MAG: hypothetical protein AAF492_24945, partial [Verrucomicrobiota bacterium]